MSVDDKTLQPFGLGPQDSSHKPTDVLRDNEGTITMVFPRKVVMFDDGGKRIEFAPGTQEVPEHLADHDWLRRNGVVRYDTPQVKLAMSNDKMVAEAQAAFDAAAEALRIAKAKARAAAPIAAPVAPEEEEAPEVDLNDLTKAQLIAHALEVHGIDLDPTAKKGEMIAAVEEARANS